MSSSNNLEKLQNLKLLSFENRLTIWKLFVIISLNELRAIQSNFGLSVEAQLFKAKQLNIISDSRYKYFCITKNQNPAFKKLVERSTYHEEQSTRFESLVYRALASELISYSKASVLLNESIDVVREQLELV